MVVSAEAREFVDARGGTVFVRPHRHRCCSGPLTLLDVTTERPTDPSAFVAVGDDRPSVHYQGDPATGPQVLTIELAGIVRRRLVAYWDGCAYKA